jgi:hypothetical protein
MSMFPYLLRCASRYVVSLSLTAVAACAAVPSLDDAKLVEVTRASTDDMARNAKAVEVRSREEFGGASFSDGKGHVVAAFSASEFGAYQAYLRNHPDSVPSFHHELTPSWPVLRMAFQSSRVLFDPDASSMPTVVFRFCGSDGNLPGFRMQQVMWRGGFITPERAQEIDNLIKTGAIPQTYEVFFEYAYWDHKQSQRGAPVTLLPLPDDLCIAMHRWNYPLPASVGHPLRISKEMVNAAVGPLPRPLPLSVGDPDRTDIPR